MRWFWAAYQMGGWRDVMDGDFPQALFRETLMQVMAEAEFDWVLEARGKDGGLRPVALVLGYAVGRGVEPGVQWFPWATTRNQVEAAAIFLKEISKVHKIMVFARHEADRFWSTFVKTGMIRRGCKVVDYFSRGEHAMFFYTVGPI